MKLLVYVALCISVKPNIFRKLRLFLFEIYVGFLHFMLIAFYFLTGWPVQSKFVFHMAFIKFGTSTSPCKVASEEGVKEVENYGKA